MSPILKFSCYIINQTFLLFLFFEGYAGGLALVAKLLIWNYLMFSLYYQLNFFADFYFAKVMRVDWHLSLSFLCGIP